LLFSEHMSVVYRIRPHPPVRTITEKNE
jgi:hypothetical protein